MAKKLDFLNFVLVIVLISWSFTTALDSSKDQPGFPHAEKSRKDPWMYVLDTASKQGSHQDPPSGMSSPAAASPARPVRCYCNLPACVTTGYLCKSPLGGCFSELPPDIRLARHGCVDDEFSSTPPSKCMNSPLSPGAVRASSIPLMLCCFRDLCNHVDNPESRLRLNDTIPGIINSSGSLVPQSGSASAGSAGEAGLGEVWFRAATIAVPICGAFILFILIALAVRILKTDAADSTKLNSGAAYIPHGSSQSTMDQPLMKKSPFQHAIPSHKSFQPSAAPLLITHNPDNFEMPRDRHKNETNAALNQAVLSDGDNAYIIMQHCPRPQSSPVHKPTNTNRDVNINIAHGDTQEHQTYTSKLYEKQRLPPDDRLYNKETIIYWGQTGSSNVNH